MTVYQTYRLRKFASVASIISATVQVYRINRLRFLTSVKHTSFCLLTRSSHRFENDLHCVFIDQLP